MDEILELTPDDPTYPPGLTDLEDSPSLWVVGSLVDAPAVAVVGSRKCTRYGIDLAEGFGRALSRAGWVTVSGLARGIDTAAHRGCLDGSGLGIAVLGSGVDVCYPAENRGLYQRLVSAGGAVVSEYPAGTPPDRWRFPERNRIIAAMAEAVVVVESAVTGGSLITARLAAEIGRPVFVVPGDVDRVASEGCNRLIKDGAHPVLGPEDLIEELSLVIGPPADPVSVRHSIPVTGLSIAALPAHWGLTLTETMVKLGRLEMSGEIRRSGDTVFPL